MIKNAFELRTIGNLLIERRKERGLSIDEVAEITKIRKVYIQALEESNYKAFESEVYIKGFLKNYAKVLGINVERAIAMYRRERQIKDKTSTINTTSKIKDKNSNFELTPNRIVTGVAIIIAILTFSYIGSYIGKILQDPELTITAPVLVTADTSETYQTNQSVLELSGDVEIGSSLTINGQIYETNNFETFFTQLNLTEGRNEFKLIATSEFGKDTIVTIIVIYEKDTANTTETEDTTLISEEIIEDLTIIITVSDRESYISLTLDGQQATRKIYQPGDEIKFTAGEEIRLYTPRPDALTVTVNGEEYIIDSSRTYIWDIQDNEVMFE